MNTYQLAIDIFGKEKQFVKTVEELAELAKELCRVANGDMTRTRIEKVAEEIADVEIMLKQVKYMLPVKESIAKYKGIKLIRLREEIFKDDGNNK